MEDIDIIILLENSFDNAIEAVEKCNDRKEIRFNIRNVNSMLILKIWQYHLNRIPKVMTILLKPKQFLF